MSKLRIVALVLLLAIAAPIHASEDGGFIPNGSVVLDWLDNVWNYFVGGNPGHEAPAPQKPNDDSGMSAQESDQDPEPETGVIGDPGG